MAPTIHLIRHAQGYHNLSVENEFSIIDPDLTPVGEEQCAQLRASFSDHPKLAKLVASPLRRAIRTCDIAFGGSANLYPIILVDSLQELADAACDIGSSKTTLEAEFGTKIDADGVAATWTDKGKGSVFEPTKEALAARAKKARKTLQEIAGDGDDHIAVVSHGGFLHFLTDDWDGIPLDRNTLTTAWSNCEYRSYHITTSPVDEDDVRLVETPESWLRRQPSSKTRLSITEQMKIREFVQKRFVPLLKTKA